MKIYHMLFDNKYKLYNNYIIYTSSEFQDRWNKRWNEKLNEKFNINNFLKDLVSEIKEVDKYLLESLYKFADRIGCIYLCNLIYEHDKEKFKNPLLEEKSFLIKSSVFTPPNNFLEDYWVKHHIPFKNLDEVY
jgi:hypothetical protein